MKKIETYEPYFFIFFGLFHLHRIWGLIDRISYANFWLDVLDQKGPIYFFLIGILSVLCILGIFTFFKCLSNNYWWRWIYLFGGIYVLFDLFAIATGLQFWRQLLMLMFDITAPYWNFLWSAFILLGAFSFLLGIHLLHQRQLQKS